MTGFALSAHSWTEALYELEGILTDLFRQPGFVVFNVDRGDDPFIQALWNNTIVTIEAASTVAIPTYPNHRQLVAPGVVEQLVGLGWNPPETDPFVVSRAYHRPNFWMKLVKQGDRLPALVSELTVKTLHEVWKVEPFQVRVRSALLAAGVVPRRF